MTEMEAITTLQDIHDVAECRIKSGDQRGVVYIPPDKLQDFNIAISALKEIQKYREFEERLKKIYGDCPGLLEIVVKHLEAHEGVDLPEPIFKARLLTDGEVDRWEAYKQLGTVEELKKLKESALSGPESGDGRTDGLKGAE